MELNAEKQGKEKHRGEAAIRNSPVQTLLPFRTLSDVQIAETDMGHEQNSEVKQSMPTDRAYNSISDNHRVSLLPILHHYQISFLYTTLR